MQNGCPCLSVCEFGSRQKPKIIIRIRPELDVAVRESGGFHWPAESNHGRICRRNLAKRCQHLRENGDNGGRSHINRLLRCERPRVIVRVRPFGSIFSISIKRISCRIHQAVKSAGDKQSLWLVILIHARGFCRCKNGRASGQAINRVAAWVLGARVIGRKCYCAISIADFKRTVHAGRVFIALRGCHNYICESVPQRSGRRDRTHCLAERHLHGHVARMGFRGLRGHGNNLRRHKIRNR